MDNNETRKTENMKKDSPGLLTRALKIFTDIRPGEAPTALMLTLNIFLLMTAYYIIKPVRSALILAGKGAEWESYLSAAVVVLLIFVVKGFSKVASKLPRQRLISWVTAFFISNLVIFYFLSLTRISLGTMGIVFFVWMGIFNVMVVAQFWAFANDIYSEEAGKRMFPLVAFGAAFGGFFGSMMSGRIIKVVGLYQTMILSGALLAVCIFLTLIIHKREIEKKEQGEKVDLKEQEKPLGKEGGFKLLFRKRYLVLLAFFILTLNFINTNGQYILHHVFEKAAIEAVETGTAGGLGVEEYIGVLDADFMKYFNLFGMLLQLFLVSRIFKWFGVRRALFFLPVMALGGYFFIAMGASLILIRWVKVMENGTDYTLMNTTRHALFLITSREEKYKAKAAIDTFFHRAGDVLTAGLVFVGTTYLAFSTEKFAAVNVGLCLIWIIIGVFIYKEHKKLSSRENNETV